jgi:hypothetical protein
LKTEKYGGKSGLVQWPQYGHSRGERIQAETSDGIGGRGLRREKKEFLRLKASLLTLAAFIAPGTASAVEQAASHPRTEPKMPSERRTVRTSATAG